MSTAIEQEVRQQEQIIDKPTSFAVFRRDLVHTLAEPLSPRIFSYYPDAYEKAEDLVRSGKGLVIFFPHPSKRDPFEVFNGFIVKSDVMKRVPILIPTAAHQATTVQKALARILDVRSPYIVTDHSIAHGFQKGAFGNGMKEYLALASQVIHAGGIVGVAVQGGRASSLGEPRPTGSLLIRRLQHDNLQFATTYIGVGIQGVITSEQFESHSGLNLLKTYVLNCGSVERSDEIFERFLDEKGRLTREFDNHVYEELRKLTHSSYH